MRTAFSTTAVLSKIAAEHDLSLTQLRVLAILRDRHASMSDLATYLGLDKSTISGLVDRAEKRGLLQRAPNPLDGRGVDVALTAEGIELAEQRRREDRARPLTDDERPQPRPRPAASPPSWNGCSDPRTDPEAFRPG